MPERSCRGGKIKHVAMPMEGDELTRNPRPQRIHRTGVAQPDRMPANFLLMVFPHVTAKSGRQELASEAYTEQRASSDRHTSISVSSSLRNGYLSCSLTLIGPPITISPDASSRLLGTQSPANKRTYLALDPCVDSESWIGPEIFAL